MLDNMDQFTVDQQEEIIRLLDDHRQLAKASTAYNDLIAFCQYMMPGYIVGTHHRKLANLLMELEKPPQKRPDGTIIPNELDRIAVSIPPRHGKSQITSIYFVAWFLGRNPDKKVIMASHTGDLSKDFGREVRNIFASDLYQELFPGVRLAADSKAAGSWDTNYGGKYYACGVGAALAGRGADLLIIDDPHSEQDILAGNFDTYERAYKWYTTGARTRLMPGGRVAVVHTRWSEEDLIGRLVRDMTRDEEADQFELFEFPALLEIPQEDGTIVEKALWPQFFDVQALKRTRASMPTYQWNAQYQQNPTGEESALIKRAWFRYWKQEKPPTCSYKIMTLDAAAEANNRADYTALQVWGIFHHEREDANHIILLESVQDRVEFPELKELAKEYYLRWAPDTFIVEKKSSGTALYQELRRAGAMVSEYTPVRGTQNNPNTKYARLNSVADMVKDGVVWVPEHKWAEDFVEEVAGFPNKPHDDLVDCFIMAMMRFRQGGLVRLGSDPKLEKPIWRGKRRYSYAS